MLYEAPMVKSNHPTPPLTPCNLSGLVWWTLAELEGGSFGDQDRAGAPWPGKAEDSTARGEKSQNAAQSSEAGQI